jgi:hypothetical protein
MEDLVQVLDETSSNEIEERRATGDKNIFAIGWKKKGMIWRSDSLRRLSHE